jgi:hypothetical protein
MNRAGRPPAPPAPWLDEARELLATMTMPRVANHLRAAGEMPGLTALQAYHRLRWELGRAPTCGCGATKAHSAVMCMPCRREHGWRRGRTGPEPRLIDEPTIELARKLHDDGGLGFRTIAAALLDRTGYRNVASAAESLRSQWLCRGWQARPRAEATAIANQRRAGKLPSVEEIVREHDFALAHKAPALTEPLAVGNWWLLPAPNPRPTFNEFPLGRGSMSVLAYYDPDNECRHGWLPHEGCQACAGVIELPQREDLAIAA